jgi:hypothetical protein
MNFICLALGIFAGLLIDVAWWHTQINKYEKGIAVNLEHYHWGLILLLVYAATNLTFIVGVGIALILAEWCEPFSYETKHPFSLGSGHFTSSLLIAIALIIIIVIFSIIF